MRSSRSRCCSTATPLNITCVSYAGTLNFGFTGARDTLPHLQRLAIYMGEALEELEQVLGPAPGAGRHRLSAYAPRQITGGIWADGGRVSATQEAAG